MCIATAKTVRKKGGAGTQRFDSKNSSGDVLSGRLELPDGNLEPIALLAHCFTCGKDNQATTRLTRTLARARIVALCFDFTGLGASEGDFRSAGFTSNIDDLRARADALRGRNSAPNFLVGYSLGGAAALAAAHRIPEIAEVVTIGDYLSQIMS